MTRTTHPTTTTHRAAGGTRTGVIRLAVVAGLSGALLLPAAPALAHDTSSSASSSSTSQDGSFGDRVVQEASRHDGKGYTYGATGPGEFDCSGYIQFVFGQVGVQIPRTIADQYATSAKVDKAAAQPGDLIAYQNSSGRVTHGGMYAGGGKVWIASTGSDRVMLQSIYSDRYSVGRFG